MRVTRCFVEVPLQSGDELALPESAANHLVRVLRLRAGDACVLFNGNGNDYDAQLLSTDKRGAVARIGLARAIGNESPLRLTLMQGIARGEKMDLILQKATELGVTALIPVTGERTEVRLDAQRTEKRLVHWRSVIASACEQSGRACVPTLETPASLADAVDAVAAIPLKLILDPHGEHTLANLPAVSSTSIVIAIGPEGGWSPRDRGILQGQGFAGLRLGPRILRTETAGLAAIAALQSRFGDMER